MNKDIDHYSDDYGLRFPRSLIPTLVKSILTDSSNPRTLKVFEIGFGIGNNARMLKEFGFADYYGIEISKSALIRIDELTEYPKNFIFELLDFVEVALRKGKFIDKKFDIIIESASLQHCTNDLNEMSRLIEFISEILEVNGNFVTQWSGRNNLDVGKRFSKFFEYELARNLLSDHLELVSEYKSTTLKLFPENKEVV